MKLKLLFLVVLACVGLIAALISPVVMSTSARTDMTMTNDDDDDDDDDGDISEGRIRRGLAIAPVPLTFRRKNRALVGLGSYIVNAVGDCNGCHTTNTGPFLPGGDPFVGEVEKIDPDKYLVGGTNFGPFVSRNLRPRADTGLPAGLTFEQFLLVMRTGADLKHIPPTPPGDLLQVMPWPAYAKMKTQDIRAIYEYLKALPPHPGYPE
jgi:hypothetical protein